MANDTGSGPTVRTPGEAGLLDGVLDALPGVVYRCRNDPDWTMLGITENVRPLTGFGPEDLVGNATQAFGRLIHPDDRERVWHAIQASVADDGDFRVLYRVVHRDGGVRWVVEQGRRLESGELTGYILELTGPLAERLGRQQGEVEALRSRTRDLEILQRVTGIVNEEVTLEGALKATLPVLCRDLGFVIAHVIMPQEGRDEGLPDGDELWWVQTPGPAVDALLETLRATPHDPELGMSARVFRTGGAAWVTELLADADFICVHEVDPLPVTSGIGVPIRSGDRCIAVLECYTAERRDFDAGLESLLVQVGVQLGRAWEREEAVRRSEADKARFRLIAEHMDDVFWTGPAGDAAREYASPAYRTIWGRDPVELRRDPRSWLEAVHPSDRERVEDVVRGRGTRGYEIQYRIVRPGGEVRWISDRAVPVADGEGPATRVVGVSEDVTERTRLEGRLRAAHRMEAVGRLAGGIAHDFNNLLTVIRAQSDFLLMDLSSESPLVEEVEVVRSAADRAAELTRQLLAFSREQVLRPRVVDLVGVVRNMEQLLVRVLGEDVRIETEFEADLPPVRVDPGQIEQVIMNLAVNARDAMPDGGVLTLRAWSETLTAEVAAGRTELVVGARYVRLDVTDTGQGMDEAVRGRIFEPFYTTKRSRGGTGLGLAMAYGIVKQSGGTIHVNSTLGEGSTFVLRFPPVVDATVSAAPPAESPAPVGAVAGTILVVEDDPAVRRVADRTLRNEGLSVRVAPDAETGLEMLEAAPQEYAYLLTDLVLPGRSGRDLLEEVLRNHPHVRCMAMSGYAEGSPDRRMDLPPEVAFVQKPFTADALLRALALVSA